MTDALGKQGRLSRRTMLALSALALGSIVFGILKAGTWGFVGPKPDAPEWFGLSPVIWLIFAGGVVLVLAQALSSSVRGFSHDLPYIVDKARHSELTRLIHGAGVQSEGPRILELVELLRAQVRDVARAR